MIFKQLAMAAILFFQNEAKNEVYDTSCHA